ncbi:tectonic [Drosophila grimshawi]|nr:tectonic [Drosophila grimshawi]
MHQCIKIGISHNYNISTTTTTAAAITTTTEIPGTTVVLDPISTDSPLPETASTTTQIFPPRKTQKPPLTTTTAAPTTKTVATVATAETQPLNATESPKTLPPLKIKSFNYCACDLHSDVCELNCCCDRDCPPEALLVFSCAQPATEEQLRRRLEDFQYNHGLSTCQLNDGWLCVFRSNSKPPKIKAQSNNFDAEQYKKWPELLVAYESQLPLATQFTAHYKYGEALQLWQPDSKTVSYFELPIGYESASCQLKRTLLHLQPMHSSCLMSDASQLQLNLWTLLNLTNSHQLLSKPRELDDQDLQGINIQVCQQLLLKPKELCLEANETEVDILVDSIELQLLHNYTHILAAKLLLREANQQDENEEIWLTYQLSFESINAIKAKPSSGPLGYVQGAPILVTTLQTQNNSKTLLSYFQGNASEDQQQQHWLTPCSPHNSAARHAVAFGVDLARQCQLSELSPVQPQLGNHTDYCQHLQSHIWAKLLPNNCTRLEDIGQVYISQLGRPQLNKWLPLQLSYADGGQQLPPILGFYDEQLQSLSCRNMLLSVSYEFYVADQTWLEAGQVPHQSVLQHVRLVVGQRHDLEFDAGEQQVELPLAVSVRFFKSQDKRLNGSHIAIATNSGLIFIMFLFSLMADKSLHLS